MHRHLLAHAVLQMALRRRSGINAVSRLEVLAAEKDFYVARVDDRLAFKRGGYVGLD